MRASGGAEGTFSWRVVARRKDIAGLRFQPVVIPREPVLPHVPASVHQPMPRCQRFQAESRHRNPITPSIHLTASKWRQVGLGGPADEVDFEVIGREVRAAFARRETTRPAPAGTPSSCRSPRLRRCT